ncbi:MAG: pyrimidine 5'-nucleotidase [Spirochaeta sp.]|nr:pyrimidine 5'-nucleotidase [Spirochaeta sp.]
MQPAYILFDLDETLYPASSELLKEVGRRMTEYVSGFLKVDPEKALSLRRELTRKYGTTLKGLLVEYDLGTADEYLEYCHPAPVDKYLSRDPELAKVLTDLAVPKSILTNSPLEHAERVLDYLQVRNCFEHIFDIRFNNFSGKPDPDTYRKTLSRLKRNPEEVLFIDDRLAYLLPFQSLGGQVLLVSANGREEAQSYRIPAIGDIKELPDFLDRAAAAE